MDPMSDRTQKAVCFDDPVIEEKIRKVLCKQEGHIFQNELDMIEKLDWEGEPIGSLDDLRFLPNLKELFIEVNCQNLQSVWFLPGLSILEIEIFNGSTVDFSHFSPLEHLEYLGVYGDFFRSFEYTNLSKLAKCRKLDELILSDAGAIDLAGIGKIETLNALTVEFSDTIKNVEEIKKIRGLRYLSMVDVPLQDLNFLRDLDASVELDFCGVRVKENSDPRIFERFPVRSVEEMEYGDSHA